MSNYTFTFKKDDFCVEYDTTDKESMERQFQIWVTCASVYTYNKEKIERGLMAQPLPKVEAPHRAVTEQQKCFNEQNNEHVSCSVTDAVTQVNNLEIEHSEVEKESERIIQEYKAEMEADEKRKKTSMLKQEFKAGVDEVIAKEEEVQEQLEGLYSGKTINSLQHEDSGPLVENKIEDKQDFDAIFENTLANKVAEPKEKKDERFLKVFKVKNIKNKVDYLIVAAYYLCEFEKLDRFTLKQVNSKLMENVSEVIDHGILQDAIDKGLVEPLQDYTNAGSSTEYRLTEAGEEAFLNGSE